MGDCKLGSSHPSRASGLTTVGVSFELPEIPVVHMKDRLFSVSMSIVKA